MGSNITSNMAEEATLRYSPNNWDLAGSLTGIYGVAKKAGEHLATVSRWLGEKSVVQEKMSALGLGAAGLGFGLMAKSGLEALERKLGFIQRESKDPTEFQDTNTLIQTLLMGVNLVRKSKQAQFWSFIAGAGLDLYDILSNWGEAPSGQNWMRLGMFAFFNTGSHNQARLTEAAEQSVAHAAHVASRIKPQHLAGGLGMLASNEAWASIGAHAVAHPVLWGGGVLVGLGAVLKRNWKPDDYRNFLIKYVREVHLADPAALSQRRSYSKNDPLYARRIKDSTPSELTLSRVLEIEIRHGILAGIGGYDFKNLKLKKNDRGRLREVLWGGRVLYGRAGLLNQQVGHELGLGKESTRLFFDGKYNSSSSNDNRYVRIRLGHFLGLEELAGLPPGTLLAIYFGYRDWPSLLGGNPTSGIWSGGFGRFLDWKRELAFKAKNDLAGNLSFVSVHNIETTQKWSIGPEDIWAYEKALGLPFNSALAFLLRDPSVIKQSMPSLDDIGLRSAMDRLLNECGLKKREVMIAMGSNNQTFSRLTTGHVVIVKGKAVSPNYNIKNVVDLERSFRVAIARALWLRERTKMIEESRDTLIAAAQRELKPRSFFQHRDGLKDSAKRQINEAKKELDTIDSDDLVTRYQDQLPPVGFLMRYAFGVGASQV